MVWPQFLKGWYSPNGSYMEYKLYLTLNYHSFLDLVYGLNALSDVTAILPIRWATAEGVTINASPSCI